MRHSLDQASTAELVTIATRVIPGSDKPRVERMMSGGSTPVYRLQRGDIRGYLRLAETPHDSFGPEIAAHGLMRARGIRVPEVVYAEPFNHVLGRPLIVTTEIPGEPLSMAPGGVPADVLVEAGRDLAAMHSIEVEGFGFVCRDRPQAPFLTAPYPTLVDLAREGLEMQLSALATVLSPRDAELLSDAVERLNQMCPPRQAILVHGDFNGNHIYHHDGQYSGIIDLGEIRGAAPGFDLGHFALHDMVEPAAHLTAHLCRGYQDGASWPRCREASMRFWRARIGVRMLARGVSASQSVRWRNLLQSVRGALAELDA